MKVSSSEGQRPLIAKPAHQANVRAAPLLWQLFYPIHDRGGERVAETIAETARLRGWSTRTLGFYRVHPDEPARYAIEDIWPSRPGLVSIVPAFLQLCRMMRRDRPDAVICHTQIAGLLGSLSALLADVRTRIAVHHVEVGLNGKVFRQLDKLAGASGLYTGVVFVGESLRRAVADFPRAYQRRASVIENGVRQVEGTPRDEARSSLGWSRDDFVVLCVGSLSYQKNHETLIEGLAGMPDVRLVLVGQGERRAELEALAQSRGVRLELTGQVSEASVDRLLSAADLFAFPSRWEGRSLALMEARAEGLPLLVSDIAENRDVAGPAAWYCAPEDVEAWRIALTRLRHEPETLRNLRAASAALPVRRDKDMAADYLDMVERLTVMTSTPGDP
jgi:glycosyltransferase involved in cell wall biosynthesis